jgi:hypothetical protein
MLLEQKNFYRNKLGYVVMIVGTVRPDNRFYRQGFRFIDHEGSYYTPEGSVKSWIWGQLDLVESVALEAVTDAEMTNIVKEMVLLFKRYYIMQKTFDICVDLIPFLAGFNIGGGVMILARGSLQGLFHILYGVAALKVRDRLVKKVEAR